MHMRTTLFLDDAILAEAIRQTGVKEKTAVVHLGWRRSSSGSRLAGSRRWAVRCLGWMFRRARRSARRK
jgi:Arc/MetJ family transcription regulator